GQDKRPSTTQTQGKGQGGMTSWVRHVMELQGMDTLWGIALDATDTDVSFAASTLLIDLHYRLGPKLSPRGAKIRGQFVNTCLGRVAESLPVIVALKKLDEQEGGGSITLRGVSISSSALLHQHQTTRDSVASVTATKVEKRDGQNDQNDTAGGTSPKGRVESLSSTSATATALGTWAVTSAPGCKGMDTVAHTRRVGRCALLLKRFVDRGKEEEASVAAESVITVEVRAGRQWEAVLEVQLPEQVTVGELRWEISRRLRIPAEFIDLSRQINRRNVTVLETLEPDSTSLEAANLAPFVPLPPPTATNKGGAATPPPGIGANPPTAPVSVSHSAAPAGTGVVPATGGSGVGWSRERHVSVIASLTAAATRSPNLWTGHPEVTVAAAMAAGISLRRLQMRTGMADESQQANHQSSSSVLTTPSSVSPKPLPDLITSDHLMEGWGVEGLPNTWRCLAIPEAQETGVKVLHEGARGMMLASLHPLLEPQNEEGGGVGEGAWGETGAGAAGTAEPAAGDTKTLRKISMRISSASSLVAGKPGGNGGSNTNSNSSSMIQKSQTSSFASLPRPSLRGLREQLTSYPGPSLSSGLGSSNSQASGSRKQAMQQQQSAVLSQGPIDSVHTPGATTSRHQRKFQSLSPPRNSYHLNSAPAPVREAPPLLPCQRTAAVGGWGLIAAALEEEEEDGEDGEEKQVGGKGKGAPCTPAPWLLMPPPPPSPPLPHKPEMLLLLWDNPRASMLSLSDELGAGRGGMGGGGNAVQQRLVSVDAPVPSVGPGAVLVHNDGGSSSGLVAGGTTGTTVGGGG
ncbi:unnamed protein product, partial [Choristocarpus tenellus]